MLFVPDSSYRLPFRESRASPPSPPDSMPPEPRDEGVPVPHPGQAGGLGEVAFGLLDQVAEVGRLRDQPPPVELLEAQPREVRRLVRGAPPDLGPGSLRRPARRSRFPQRL